MKDKKKWMTIKTEEPKLIFKGNEINTQQLLMGFEETITLCQFEIDRLAGTTYVPREIHLQGAKERQASAEFMKYLVMEALKGNKNE